MLTVFLILHCRLFVSFLDGLSTTIIYLGNKHILILDGHFAQNAKQNLDVEKAYSSLHYFQPRLVIRFFLWQECTPSNLPNSHNTVLYILYIYPGTLLMVIYSNNKQPKYQKTGNSLV